MSGRGKGRGSHGTLSAVLAAKEALSVDVKLHEVLETKAEEKTVCDADAAAGGTARFFIGDDTDEDEAEDDEYDDDADTPVGFMIRPQQASRILQVVSVTRPALEVERTLAKADQKAEERTHAKVDQKAE